MKFTLLLLLLIVSFSACELSGDKFRNIEFERDALKLQIDSLRLQIAELKKNPDVVLQESQDKLNQRDFSSAKQSLVAMQSWQLNTRQADQFNKLISVLNKKLEEQDYNNLFEADTTLYVSFLSKYPNSANTGKIKKTLKRIRQSRLESRSVRQSNSRTYRQKGKSYSSSRTERVGAVCCDGSRS